MLEQVKKVLASALNIEVSGVNETTTLKEDLGIDSLAAVELAMELESAFNVRIVYYQITGSQYQILFPLIIQASNNMKLALQLFQMVNYEY